MFKISPSVLSADFAALGADAKRMEICGADMLHLDIMDGRFVPNITFGMPVIRAIRPHTSLFFDVHLMIEEPIRYIQQFADAGANGITVHTEACSDIAATLDAIETAGCKPCLSVKPATPIEVVYPYLDRLAMVLVMTVEPGFGGQSFMADMLDKTRALRAHCNENGIAMDIQVDGGISRKTVKQAADAGVNVFVAGSAIFGAADAREEMDALRTLAQA